MASPKTRVKKRRNLALKAVGITVWPAAQADQSRHVRAAARRTFGCAKRRLASSALLGPRRRPANLAPTLSRPSLESTQTFRTRQSYPQTNGLWSSDPADRREAIDGGQATQPLVGASGSKPARTSKPRESFRHPTARRQRLTFRRASLRARARLFDEALHAASSHGDAVAGALRIVKILGP